mmetsp:Transcript_42550/g.63131  ORF Transcript_42550/g.63131 Transcript_42550/m.63131 type:complete len:236 (-) Transcript_42550:590-1297(-)
MEIQQNLLNGRWLESHVRTRKICRRPSSIRVKSITIKATVEVCGSKRRMKSILTKTLLTSMRRSNEFQARRTSQHLVRGLDKTKIMPLMSTLRIGTLPKRKIATLQVLPTFQLLSSPKEGINMIAAARARGGLVARHQVLINKNQRDTTLRMDMSTHMSLRPSPRSLLRPFTMRTPPHHRQVLAPSHHLLPLDPTRHQDCRRTIAPPEQVASLGKQLLLKLLLPHRIRQPTRPRR